jgi:hypothetical protein
MYQYKSFNVGGIRNQGWELQGSVTTGPLTSRGTYSWTKSRVLGITPKYREFFANIREYQPGAVFGMLPEHTWALGFTYAQGRTTVALNMTGNGQIPGGGSAMYYNALSSSIRLMPDRQSLTFSGWSVDKGYVLSNLSAARRFSSWVEGVLQIDNLTNRYRNDYDLTFPVMGRQTKGGLRIRL